MTRFCVLFALVGLAVSAPPSPSLPDHTAYRYLDRVGVPLARRIKAAEDATDFDGARIIGGTAARLGEYPYMGGLVITLSTGFQAVCSSALITNSKAITAAHCWWDGWNQARQFVVVLGSLLVFSGGVRVTTSDVTTHEFWNPIYARDDLAIISFPSVVYTVNIRNIALPSGQLLTNNLVGSTVKTAGFGTQSETGSILIGQVLHHVQLQILNNAICESAFGPDVVHQTTLCASGTGGRSTCRGDGGAPLAFSWAGSQVLVGVASFVHRDSCQMGYPSGATRLAPYVTWINQIIYS